MADTLPTVNSVSLNKNAYAPGEQMILTVVGSDPDEEVVEVTVTLRNRASGAASMPATATATVDELEAIAEDSGSRAWEFVARSGDTFTLKATA